MAFRTTEEFEQILRDTPPAARYLDMAWCIARSTTDWLCIKYRMIGAAHAVPFSSEEHDDYMLLANVADARMESTLRITPPVSLKQGVTA